MQLNLEKFIGGLHDYIGKALEPLSARIKKLEAHQPERGEKGEKGDTGEPGRHGLDGKDGTPGERGETGPAGERGEKGDTGPPGRDGTDGKESPPGARGEQGLKGEIGERGEKGDKGDPGEPGRNGVDGKDGAPGERGVAGLAGERGEKGEKGDTGEPGQNGADGTPGARGEKGDKGDPGERGVDGAPGHDGIDGKSVTLEEVRAMFGDLFVSEQSKWALEFERRAADLIQRCIDRIPKPADGKPGRDAFELEDIQLSLADDDRTLTVAFVRGEDRVERSLKLHHVIYRGIWKDKQPYMRGDSVTWNGCSWIATCETQAKPGSGEDWKLAVKAGRDGKDGLKGEPGIRGPKGLDGNLPRPGGI